jgi:squalene synthase HpnC
MGPPGLPGTRAWLPVVRQACGEVRRDDAAVTRNQTMATSSSAVLKPPARPAESTSIDSGPSSIPASSKPSPAPLPADVTAALRPAASIDEAQAFTRKLAGSHYENFSVVTLLLPRHLRQDFCNVYAFCRTADDLGDELGDRNRSLELLEDLARRTRRCYDGQTEGMLFTALRATIERHHIPAEPFLDLIDAFAQDQRVRRYETFDQLRDYCRRSADPVGRLVLYMCGYRDGRRQQLSDFTCTALQLANFWQDVRRDLHDLDRIYIPAESMGKFGVTEDQLRAGRVDQAYRDLIRFEVERTEQLFQQGDELLPLLNNQVRPQVKLFGMGGRAILQAIRDRDYDTLTSRPSLSKWQKGRLVLSVFAVKLLPAALRAERRARP